LLTSFALSGQPCNASSHEKHSGQNQYLFVVFADGPNEHSTGETDQAEPGSDAPKWYATFEHADGMLVIVGFITCMVIGWQTMQTRKAANAAMLSAKAALDAERAWLLVTVGKLDKIDPKPNAVEIMWISPRVTNEGKSPAWMSRMRLRAQQFPSMKDIPSEPVYEAEGTMHFDGEATLPSGASVAPLRVGLPVTDFIAIRQGGSFLYVYGIIDYLDIAKRPCTTRFCFLYHVPGGYNPIPEGFVFGGPTAYNKAE